jgi:hypothetical protein
VSLLVIPKGCTITDIRRGRAGRSDWIYAKLVRPDGELLISATLDYILDALNRCLVKKEDE